MIVVPVPGPAPISSSRPVPGYSGHSCIDTYITWESAQNMSWVPLPWCASQSTIRTRAPRSAQRRGRDGDVVHQAEPHRAGGQRVVPGRPHGTESGRPLAPFQRVDRLEPRAGGQQRRRPRVGRDRRCRDRSGRPRARRTPRGRRDTRRCGPVRGRSRAASRARGAAARRSTPLAWSPSRTAPRRAGRSGWPRPGSCSAYRGSVATRSIAPRYRARIRGPAPRRITRQ